MDKKELEAVLRGFVGMLSLISIDDLETHINDVARNNEIYDAAGPIFNPTEYRNTLASGRRDNARTQLEIVRHCLEIRKLFDKLPLTLE